MTKRLPGADRVDRIVRAGGWLAHRMREGLGYLDAVAAFWLGCSLPLPEEAMREARWRPDAPAAYCRRCGDSVGPGECTGSGCGSCRGRSSIGQGFVRLGAYCGVLRHWILRVKYRDRWAEMGEHLGCRLGAAVAASGLVDPGRVVVIPIPMPWRRRVHRGIDHAAVIAAGVARGLRSRSVARPTASDPIGPVARGGAGATSVHRPGPSGPPAAKRGGPMGGLGGAGWPAFVRPIPRVRALVKTGGVPQARLDRRQRTRRSAHRVRLRWPLRHIGRFGPVGRWVRGRHLVLVDDVRTTGATLRSAVRRLNVLGPDRIVVAVVAVRDPPDRRGGERVERPDPSVVRGKKEFSPV